MNICLKNVLNHYLAHSSAYNSLRSDKNVFFFLILHFGGHANEGRGCSPPPRILPGYAIGCRLLLVSNTKLVNAVTSIIYHIAHFTMYTPNNCLV